MHHSGFISVRTVVALCIVMSVMPIAVSSIELLSKIEERYDLINDELCLYRLRRILLIAYDVEIDDCVMSFVYKDSERQLSLVNGRLVMTPGYQMFLNDVDSLYFRENDGCIELVYEKDNKEYKVVLCEAEGICIADFCDNSDADDELYSDNE
ncbi:MAG: hypothetical protein ACI4WM_03560 [Erysipelotrichaceae bacterium]